MKIRCICDNKKGLSQVVTTLLFVLIALGAVLLVWNLVRALITDSADDIDVTEFNLRYELEGKNLYVNAPHEKVSFVIKRNAGEGEVKGFSILLEDETGESSSFESDVVVGELESKRVEIDYSGRGLGKIVKVSIAPILTSDSGAEKVGNILAETNVPDERRGNALSFDGVEDYVSLGDMDMGDSDVAISAWFKPTGSTADYRRIVALASSEATSIGATILLWPGGNSIVTYYDTSSGCISSLTASANVWNHFVMIYDGTNIRNFLNGVEGIVCARGAITGWTGNDFIGALSANSQEFNGEIDDVRIYDGVLTSDEISNLYGGDYSGGVASDNLVAWYKFDDGVGSTAEDSSGNGNDGTIVGAEWVY